MNPAEPQKPHMLYHVSEGYDPSPALRGVHPISMPGIIPEVRFTSPPDINSVERVIENRQIDAKDLQPDHERQSGKKFHLLSVGMGPVSGSSIRGKMLKQESAYGDDAA